MSEITSVQIDLERQKQGVEELVVLVEPTCCVLEYSEGQIIHDI